MTNTFFNKLFEQTQTAFDDTNVVGYNDILNDKDLTYEQKLELIKLKNEEADKERKAVTIRLALVGGFTTVAVTAMTIVEKDCKFKIANITKPIKEAVTKA